MRTKKCLAPFPTSATGFGACDRLKSSWAAMDADFGHVVVRGPFVHGGLLIKAIIDGHTPVTLVTSEGAGLTILGQEVPGRARYGPERFVGSRWMDDKSRVIGQAVLLDSIEIGGAKAEKTVARVEPVDFEGTDGFLGLNVLELFDAEAEMDYGGKSGQLHLWNLR
ncbi:MAG: hypothetical protein HY748_05395 [Elusimicrobia bacterium]|nr:hypothetical protein [Elusimicrobiota bacterium]